MATSLLNPDWLWLKLRLEVGIWEQRHTYISLSKQVCLCLSPCDKNAPYKDVSCDRENHPHPTPAHPTPPHPHHTPPRSTNARVRRWEARPLAVWQNSMSKRNIRVQPTCKVTANSVSLDISSLSWFASLCTEKQTNKQTNNNKTSDTITVTVQGPPHPEFVTRPKAPATTTTNNNNNNNILSISWRLITYIGLLQRWVTWYSHP